MSKLTEAIRLLVSRKDELGRPELREAVNCINEALGSWMRTYDGKVSRGKSCSFCGEVSNDDYMLVEELWVRVWPTGKGFMHLSCVEHLLGRQLVPSDFKDIPMNAALLFFLRRLVCVEG